MIEAPPSNPLLNHLLRIFEPQERATREQARPFVAALLEAQARGETAIQVDEKDCAWLKTRPWVGDGSHPTPVVFHDDLLQFQINWQAEQHILNGLQPLVQRQQQGASLPEDFIQQAQRQNLDPEKLVQIERALAQSLTLLTGGPGTGKTTTLAWLLAALLRQQPHLTIALASPTGKAAQRMKVALSKAIPALPLLDEQKHSLQSLVPSTLHRLLGIGHTPHPRHDKDNPLDYDLIVVDEASMVDVYTMAKLVNALPKNASLILMGDPNQLASVEAGQVLGALVQRFPEAHVALTATYRFKETIKNLAQAMLEGDGNAAWQQIQAGAEDGLHYLGEKVNLPQLAAGYQPYLQQLKAQAAPEEKAQALLEALAHYRILTALRQGPYGATYLNQSLIEHFRSQGVLAHGRGQYFAGHAIQITENDYTLGLFNGDMGVMLPTGRHDQSVWFMGEAGQLRRVPFVQLPAYETAFATTVHKAQGDEFHTAVLFLPPEPHPLVTRELIYTALTRAKKQFHLIATEASFKAGIKAKTERKSGLTHYCSINPK